MAKNRAKEADKAASISDALEVALLEKEWDYLDSNWERVEEGSPYAVHRVEKGEPVYAHDGRQLYPRATAVATHQPPPDIPTEDVSEASTEPDPDARSLKSVKIAAPAADEGEK